MILEVFKHHWQTDFWSELTDLVVDKCLSPHIVLGLDYTESFNLGSLLTDEFSNKIKILVK